ncbi:MAG: hypothetical protein JXB24_12410 [Bacteroidales bacterium]|nr:hypothetical protein [Bacteroidales bacterium]
MIAILIISFTFISVLAVTGNRKTPVISENAYLELKSLNQIIGADSNNSIVIARHGLEW